MIWATRSRSQVASGPSSGSSTLELGVVVGEGGPELADHRARELRRSTGSRWSSSEPASSRERSSRSTDSFCRRATCSLIVSRNSRRVSSSRSSSWSSSTKPAEREDRRAQLVRGGGDELLAGDVHLAQLLLHLVERARELAQLVARSRPGSGSMKRPRAISAAAASRRRTRRASACATR